METSRRRPKAAGPPRRSAVPEWYHDGVAMTIRPDDDLDHALTVLAEAEGLSKQEVIRRSVMERYERAGHAARVADSTDQMMERWGDVLDRLGSV